MGKRKRGPILSQKDRKHLVQYGEIHPADVESAKNKLKRKEEEIIGTYKRKIITAKARIPNKESKRVETEEIVKPKLEKERKFIDKIIHDAKSEENEDVEEELTREDLINLIRRETVEERVKQENKIIVGKDVEELYDEENVGDNDAIDTWKNHLELNLCDKDFEEISDKKCYQRLNLKFPFYRSSMLKQPPRLAGQSVSVYENLAGIHVKQRILQNMKNWEQREKELFSIFHQYKDVLCANTTRNTTSAYILHVLNHVTKSDTLNRNNSAKLMTMLEEEKLKTDIRDKQLIRPKAVIMVPFKANAKRIVDEIVRYMTPASGKLEVGYRKRFDKEFGSSAELEKHKKEKNRPSDFKRIFAGNSDEMFRIGIAFAPKALRLYAPFYSSDIIIASPLGLRKIIGTEDNAKQEYDFLSSVEVLVIEHADQILMQNWMHLNHVCSYLNLQPREAHDCDFSRVRLWAAEGRSKYYRQTILLGHTPNDLFNAFMIQHAFNHAGMVELKSPTPSQTDNIPLPIPQLFYRIDGPTIPTRFENRLKRFKKLIHDITKAKLTHTLVYIPSYFDYIKIRNFMTETDVKFVSVMEYSEPNEVRKCRKFFEDGEFPIMLFTERRHFYHRVVQRKVRRIIFFAPPTFGHFYPEIVNFIINPTNADVTLLYSRDDKTALTLIVGKLEARKMLNSDKPAHCIMTGNKKI